MHRQTDGTHRYTDKQMGHIDAPLDKQMGHIDTPLDKQMGHIDTQINRWDT